MKKLFVGILAAAVMISAFSGCSCQKPETDSSKTASTEAAEKTTEAVKSETKLKTTDYVLSSDYNYSVGEKDMYSTLTYVKDKYIYSNAKGIFVKENLNDEGIKISKNHPNTEWSNGALLSNGETVYYLMVKEGSDSEFEYSIYSVGIDGKNEKKVLSGIGPATLITMYKGNLYFRNSPDTSAEKDTHIMCYKPGRKKDPEMVSLDYQVNYNCFYNGKIYFSNDKFSDAEAAADKKAKYDVYSLDLDSKDINKEVEYSYGESIAAADSENAVFYSRKIGHKGKICVIDKDNNKTFSKEFKEKVDPWFVDKNSENAIMCDFNSDDREVFLTYNIKTAEHKKLSETPNEYDCEKITSGLKAGDTPYIVLSAEGDKAYSRIAVQKVEGDKASYCKFGGKKSVDADTFWITDDKLVVEVNTKMKVYDLK